MAYYLIPDRLSRCNEKQLSRTDRENLITFSDGSLQKDVWFMDSGTNSTLGITLPANINITSASMVIEGRGLTGSTTRTFSFLDVVNNNAWEGGFDGNDPTLTPNNYKDTPFGPLDYVDVAASDDIQYNTFKVNGQKPYHLFEFTINASSIEDLEVVYEGKGYFTGGMAFARHHAYLYIYNLSSGGWELVGHESAEVMMNNDFTISELYSNSPRDYIDNSDHLYLMGAGPVSPENPNDSISTDYVKVDVTGIMSIYCRDPSLNVGNEGDREWEYVGDYAEETTMDDNYDFRSRLQDIINTNVDKSEINITLSLSSKSKGILQLKNLSIEYEVIPQVSPPELIDTIPNNHYSFREDSEKGVGLIDLYEFFDDDEGKANITFSILENHTDILAFINSSTHSMDFISAENYFGTSNFHVRATDKDGLYTDSNIFNVMVTPTNDPPFLTTFETMDLAHERDTFELEIYEGMTSCFNFSVWDIDRDLPYFGFGPNQPHSDIFLLETSSENASSGILVLNPDDENIGMINFTLVLDDMNLSEGDSLKTIYNFTLIVINTNDPPEFIEMNDMVGVQDEWLNFTIVARDVDIDNDEGEKITYGTNFSEYEIDNGKWSLDENSGDFSFLPDNSDVGALRVNFTVEDRKGETDWINVIIVVKNVNDPPVACPILINIVDADDRTQKAENLTVNFTTEDASDPDMIHGDALIYYWDFDGDGLFDDEGTGVEWTYGKAGNYTITMTVSDSGTAILSSSVNITIEVFAPSKKDSDDDSDEDITEREGDTSEKGSQGIGAWVWILIGIITLLIILVLIFIFVISGRNKTEKKGEVGIQAAPATTSEPTPASASLQTLNLNPEAPVESQLPPAPLTPVSTPFGASHHATTQAPVCLKCGQASQYYSEYDCYWCAPCQDYVLMNS